MGFLGEEYVGSGAGHIRRMHMRFVYDPHAYKHKIGEMRERTAFLFLPKRIGYETRWLEHATWREYHSPSNLTGWEPLEWIDK